jgi:hypothetical protein
MPSDELTPEQIASTASNWLSTALSVPMVWPKTTVALSLAAIALSTAVWLAPIVWPASRHTQARLDQMIRAAEQRDQEYRSRAGVPVERNPEMPGVFEMMRDLAEVPEDTP